MEDDSMIIIGFILFSCVTQTNKTLHSCNMLDKILARTWNQSSCDDYCNGHTKTHVKDKYTCNIWEKNWIFFLTCKKHVCDYLQKFWSLMGLWVVYKFLDLWIFMFVNSKSKMQSSILVLKIFLTTIYLIISEFLVWLFVQIVSLKFIFMVVSLKFQVWLFAHPCLIYFQI